VGPKVRIRFPPAGSLQTLGPCQRTRALNYLRFTLSYRDVEELLAERGLDLSYETVRRLVLKFGCAYRLCHPNVVPMETAEPSD